MDDYGDVNDKTHTLSQCGERRHEQVYNSARYVRPQRSCVPRKCVCENVVIGVLVVLCDVHVTRVVVVDAVLGLTLGLIANVVVVVFVESILHRIFCLWK